MKPKKRQKLCHNCEGDVDLDVIVCPYCAADLREEKPFAGEEAPSRPMHQMSQSLYPSPYPLHESDDPLQSASFQRGEKEAAKEEKSLFSDPAWKAAGATLLFSLGVLLFLLGILLVLFSHHGQLLLRWDARLWFLYLFAAIPFLIFGYRSIAKL